MLYLFEFIFNVCRKTSLKADMFIKYKILSNKPYIAQMENKEKMVRIYIDR